MFRGQRSEISDQTSRSLLSATRAPPPPPPTYRSHRSMNIVEARPDPYRKT
jgi:hypothetical protein